MDEKSLTVAAMLEMVAYAIEEGQSTDVPAVLRMLAEVLRKNEK